MGVGSSLSCFLKEVQDYKELAGGMECKWFCNFNISLARCLLNIFSHIQRNLI